MVLIFETDKEEKLAQKQQQNFENIIQNEF